MHKAIVFYFSGTGNTWWAADQMCKQLDRRGINAECVSIETVDAKKADWWIKSSDLVFFGWPVYGSDLPAPMKKFIDHLQPLENEKHIHTFCTQLRFSGDGAWVYHKHFERKKLVIDTCAHFYMPSNFSMVRGPFGAPKTAEKADKMLLVCEKQIMKHLDKLMLGKGRAKGRWSYPLGIVQRGPFRLFYQKMQSVFGTDESRCTKCGLCAKVCPTGNIIMDGFPAYQKNCAICMRCYSCCPQAAVTFFGKRHNIDKYGKQYMIPDKRFSLETLTGRESD